MSSYATETSKLLAAIPPESHAACPGCFLDFHIERQERAKLGERVARNPIVSETLKNGRMALTFDGKGPVNSEFPVMSEERAMADCLLQRAMGACLNYVPEVNNG